MNTKRRRYVELPDEELLPELDAKARSMIAQAEEEIEEARVNFRWGKTQVDLVKSAAALIGVPYQTYIKEVVFRQALADLQGARRLVQAGRRSAR
ncbi:MAG: hypothetical protein HY675_29110 [Chloroflexi bacterium]|nr:hypothetical protein [Chloroflexota bacterium]